jgi:hypothetical protein
MPETTERMSEQYSRAELEDMARKLGIGHSRKQFPSKMSLAEAIIKVKGKETNKGKPMTSPEKKLSHRPVARVEMRAGHTGKTGVMAKKAAIDAQVNENMDDVARIDREITDFRAAVDTKISGIFGNVRLLQKNIGVEAGEIRDAAARMGACVTGLRKDIAKEKSSMDESTKMKQADVRDFQTAMDLATREIQSGVNQLENDILGLRDNIASYRQEFYFG